MTDNNLFQLAQVVTEHHPLHCLPEHEPSHRPLSTRKNACIICAVCFTCSGYYGSNCQCSETQPRRGKNLPEGGLDSRAKKLSPLDRDDYEFTLKWLDEFGHSIYRDKNQRIVGLTNLTEVSLCKAHSSTLYRAKKRHQRVQQHAPPSPADSNITMEDMIRHRSSSVDSYPLLPQPTGMLGGGMLAAKVRELSFQPVKESPDLSMMTTSTSHKRKRASTISRPNSSASTPLLYSNHPMHSSPPPLPPPPPPPPHHHHHFNARSSFSSQLPPLHLRTPSLSSLSSNLHHLHVSPSFTKVIETVSLKSSPSLKSLHYDDVYFVRNLAITDSYTFRDLLSEIDFAGSPPPGKRLVISDIRREKIFPLDQAIRNVIRYPKETHIEFYLGLSEKASINWDHYI
ncbi:uncharacterized protein B0P05DRAFT_567841 [Gilbertella persicaria]|uniref:uncharacterized protein n=1 Tax=Gilbertella persicaria TaxID=101096 RepID=UPI00221F3EFE|nr:uncharacterized protein B0P05DRAFT_567841 [Gilbertella persicaria]KAI8097857.1 hypothetical protein B0P05DRAFT_567841 [Gilbertella persicaria]